MLKVRASRYRELQSLWNQEEILFKETISGKL